MANTSAAKKYIRVSARKRAQNDSWRSKFRTLRTTFNRALDSGNMDEAKNTALKIQSSVDRMGQKNVVHKNTAARMKAHFAARLKNANVK